MPRPMRNTTNTEIGDEQAEMLSALVSGLKKRGVAEEVAVRLAERTAGAASSWLDGCSGMGNPAEALVNPIMGRFVR